MRLVEWTALALGALASCSSSADPPPVPPVSGPAELPLLGDDRVHLYVQEAYEGFSPVIREAVEDRYDELVAAGMDTARHLFDWADLEPSPGVYDTPSVVEAMLYREAAGISKQFCNVVVIDSFGPVVPDFIQDLIDAGASWDDPLITDAFADLLDVFVPIMLDQGMYMIGFANEPGGYFEGEPVQAASFAGFVSEAVAHVHSLEPQLACTVVFAGTADPSLPALMPSLDVASFNAYLYTPELDATCLLQGTIPLTLYRSVIPAQVGGLLDDLIAAAQGKLICIQEIGQSTGWDDMPQTLGPAGGLENQRACIAALQLELEARREHFRTVCLWTLNDHSREGIAYVSDALLAEGFPACYADNFDEIFGPTGLVRSDDLASTKPAFGAFLAAVSSFAP